MKSLAKKTLVNTGSHRGFASTVTV